MKRKDKIDFLKKAVAGKIDPQVQAVLEYEDRNFEGVWLGPFDPTRPKKIRFTKSDDPENRPFIIAGQRVSKDHFLEELRKQNEKNKILGKPELHLPIVFK
jgi:hypothetical protein